jgi:GntR family transcriptional repressor for pyruvate dehydrogenase complex
MIDFRPVRIPTRMPEAIAQQIENKILLGQIKPNSMLPSEMKMMNQFAVSRNTVREALRILEASGMIKIKHGVRGGAVVTQLTDEFVSDFLIKAIQLGGVSGDSLFQFRLALEPFIAEMLATNENIDQEFILQMENNISRATERYKQNKITRYLNMDFHVLIALASKNPMFIIILKTLRISLYSFKTPQIRHKMQRMAIKYHEEILDAIKKRDPIKARENMYNHLLQIREVLKDGKFVKIPYTKKMKSR